MFFGRLAHDSLIMLVHATVVRLSFVFTHPRQRDQHVEYVRCCCSYYYSDARRVCRTPQAYPADPLFGVRFGKNGRIANSGARKKFRLSQEYHSRVTATTAAAVMHFNWVTMLTQCDGVSCVSCCGCYVRLSPMLHPSAG